MIQHGIGGYPCNQYEYASHKPQDLQRDKMIQHGIGGYPCNEYEYVAAKMKGLNKHKLYDHGGHHNRALNMKNNKRKIMDQIGVCSKRIKD